MFIGFEKVVRILLRYLPEKTALLEKQFVTGARVINDEACLAIFQTQTSIFVTGNVETVLSETKRIQVNGHQKVKQTL